MDETFTFIAPVMPRRRADPFAVRLAVMLTSLVVLVAAFGAFVVRHERLSDARAAATERRLHAQADARAAAVSAALGDPFDTVDADAVRAAQRALDRALDVFAASASFTRAGLGRKGGTGSSLLVDGPSTSPVVVSVASTSQTWSAAVMGSSGTCYWVRATTSGAAFYDTGTPCTGRAAALASGPSW
jgi:hypothetical protein